MKKKYVYILLGLVAIALVVVILKPFGKKEQEVKIETATISKGEINEIITATGTLEALETVEVGTQVSGVVQEIFVDYNTIVKKGQLLAKIDETPLIATLKQSQASVESAEAEMEYQKANYERYKAMAEKNLIAQSDFDLAQYNYKKSVASLKNAQLQYERNQINLAYASIFSPIDGVILAREVDEGQTVAASFNTPTLFTIANDLTRMQVEASVDEADIGRLAKGQRVQFDVDAFPDMKFDGELIEIRYQPVESSNVITYTVVIDAPNPDKKLLPGMTANVSFYVTEKKDILLVPAKALDLNPDPSLLKAYQEKHPEININLPFSSDDKNGEKKNSEMPKSGGFPGAPAGMSGAGNFTPPAGMQGRMPGQGNVKMVWLKNGNDIGIQPVKVGETNELYYEVLTGLKEGDEVLTSVSDGSMNFGNMGPMPSSSQRSPFMPGPPGRR